VVLIEPATSQRNIVRLIIVVSRRLTERIMSGDRTNLAWAGTSI
jgi:hypothetical protein